MTYPPAPTTFEDFIKLIPPREKTTLQRFTLGERQFELQIGRTSMNVVWFSIGVPDVRWQFWPPVRTVESLTRQRDLWAHWQKFLDDPDDYLTWKYIGRPTRL